MAVVESLTMLLSSPDSVIMGYESIRDMTSNMLSYAQKGDWESLIDQEAEYVSSVEQMNGIVLDGDLTADQMAQKTSLIQECLENSQVVTELLVERQNELQTIIESEQNKQTLASAYGQVETV